ncbi:MAG: hypothetical protein HUU21_11615 [Polyangiaceae bacterium]|nr:hypothetical protein [Polyangiaceae bacterium]NUQ74194.1 hypothetical protein [Polyangiaceae bacterium]
MAASIVLKVRLGPLVSLDIHGNSCKEIMAALEGYKELNHHINEMCSDLADRVYPEGLVDVVKEAGSAANEGAPGEVEG